MINKHDGRTCKGNKNFSNKSIDMEGDQKGWIPYTMSRNSNECCPIKRVLNE